MRWPVGLSTLLDLRRLKGCQKQTLRDKLNPTQTKVVQNQPATGRDAIIAWYDRRWGIRYTREVHGPGIPHPIKKPTGEQVM